LPPPDVQAHSDEDEDKDEADDKACSVETRGKHDVRIAKLLGSETVTHLVVGLCQSSPILMLIQLIQLAPDHLLHIYLLTLLRYLDN